jgi:hypothetical protein
MGSDIQYLAYSAKSHDFVISHPRELSSPKIAYCHLSSQTHFKAHSFLIAYKQDNSLSDVTEGCFSMDRLRRDGY